MMKKLFALALALALLCAALPASAKQSAEPSVLSLLSEQAATAFVVGDGRMAVTAYHLLETAVGVLGADGIVGVEGLLCADEEADLAVIRLAADSGVAPLPVAARAPTAGDALTCVSGASSSLTVQVEGASVHGDMNFLRLACESGREGSPLLNAEGEVAAVVVGTWAEEAGVCVAVDAERLHALITKAEATETVVPLAGMASAAAQPAPLNTDYLSGFAISSDAPGMLTLDWSACDLTGLGDKAAYVIGISTENARYNLLMTAHAPETSASFSVIPGQLYTIWMKAAPSEDELDWDTSMTQEEFDQCAAYVKIPDAEPLTAHSFTTVSSCFAAVPANTEPAQGERLKAVNVTKALLRSDALTLCYWAEASYHVTETVSVMLTLVLTAPDGRVYEDDSAGFAFMADLSPDLWSISLAPILRRYEAYNDSWQAGRYVLSVYIDGALADELTFSLPDAFIN